MYASSARRPRSSRSTGPNPPTGSPPASALGVWKRRGEARCRARRAGQRLPHAPRTHHGLLHMQGRRTPLSNRCPTLASLAYGPPVGPECPTKHTARAPVNDGQRDPQRLPRQHVTAEGGVTALDEHPGDERGRDEDQGHLVPRPTSARAESTDTPTCAWVGVSSCPRLVSGAYPESGRSGRSTIPRPPQWRSQDGRPRRRHESRGLWHFWAERGAPCARGLHGAHPGLPDAPQPPPAPPVTLRHDVQRPPPKRRPKCRPDGSAGIPCPPRPAHAGPARRS